MQLHNSLRNWILHNDLTDKLAYVPEEGWPNANMEKETGCISTCISLYLLSLLRPMRKIFPVRRIIHLDMITPPQPRGIMVMLTGITLMPATTVIFIRWSINQRWMALFRRIIWMTASMVIQMRSAFLTAPSTVWLPLSVWPQTVPTA